jgi:hypothetical protein
MGAARVCRHRWPSDGELRRELGCVGRVQRGMWRRHRERPWTVTTEPVFGGAACPPPQVRDCNLETCGCATTEHRCCEDGVTAKADTAGSNCANDNSDPGPASSPAPAPSQARFRSAARCYGKCNAGEQWARLGDGHHLGPCGSHGVKCPDGETSCSFPMIAEAPSLENQKILWKVVRLRLRAILNWQLLCKASMLSSVNPPRVKPPTTGRRARGPKTLHQARVLKTGRRVWGLKTLHQAQVHRMMQRLLFLESTRVSFDEYHYKRGLHSLSN